MNLAGLLDTNILIDILRDYPPAITWLDANPHLELGIPSIVRMEMMLGAANKTQQRRIIRLITPFPLIYPNERDARWAMEQFEAYNLSHQIEILDCFIAAIGANSRLPIYTRNTRDFRVFADVETRKPY